MAAQGNLVSHVLLHDASPHESSSWLVHRSTRHQDPIVETDISTPAQTRAPEVTVDTLPSDGRAGTELADGVVVAILTRLQAEFHEKMDNHMTQLRYLRTDLSGELRMEFERLHTKFASHHAHVESMLANMLVSQQKLESSPELNPHQRSSNSTNLAAANIFEDSVCNTSLSDYATSCPSTAVGAKPWAQTPNSLDEQSVPFTSLLRGHEQTESIVEARATELRSSSSNISQISDTSRKSVRPEATTPGTDSCGLSVSGSRLSYRLVKLRTYFHQDSRDNFLARFSQSATWYVTCALFILVRAAVTGVEIEVLLSQRQKQFLNVRSEDEHNSASYLRLFYIFEIFSVAWMIGELFVNIYGQTAGFTKCGCRTETSLVTWNAFDALIILLSLALLAIETKSSWSFALLRIAQMFRLGRYMRSLRAFKLSRSIHNTIIALMASLSNLASSFLVMLVFIYLFALCMIQGILFRVDAAQWQLTDSTTSDLSFWADEESDQPAVQVARLYGSVPKAMLTLFMAVSGGMDWIDAARPVTRHGPFFVALWTIYVLFMVFGLLNVLVGIFVDGAMQSVRLDRDQLVRDEVEMTEMATQRLTKIFFAADRDRSGCIDKEEFEFVLRQPQTVTQLKALGIDSVSAHTLFRMLDVDRSGQVSHDEFIAGCLRLRGNARSADMVALLYQSQKSHQKVNAILKEMRNLHGGMNKAIRVSSRQQAPVASSSPQICTNIFPVLTDSSDPWIQPWKPCSAVDV